MEHKEPLKEAFSQDSRESSHKDSHENSLETSHGISHEDSHMDSSEDVIAEGLTQALLKERLKVSSSSLSHAKTKNKEEPGYFLKWSQERDPDQVAWEWNQKDKLFYPFKHNPSA